MNPFKQVTDLIERNKEKKQKEKAMQITVVRVMQTVGGYENFMKLPIPVYQEVAKGLIELDKLELEKQKALMGVKTKGSKH